MKTHIKLRLLTKYALFAAVLCVLSPLALPVGAVPITLATLVLYLSIVFLGVRSVIPVGVYLMIGSVGMPVFSGARGGLAVLVGPTGGYLVGYLACALVGGLLVDRFPARMCGKALALLLGTVCLYALGTVWFMLFMTGSYTLTKALCICVLPFLPGDFFKLALACMLERAFRQKGFPKF